LKPNRCQVEPSADTKTPAYRAGLPRCGPHPVEEWNRKQDEKSKEEKFLRLALCLSGC
jgi:hypothetical protein